MEFYYRAALQYDLTGIAFSRAQCWAFPGIDHKSPRGDVVERLPHRIRKQDSCSIDAQHSNRLIRNDIQCKADVSTGEDSDVNSAQCNQPFKLASSLLLKGWDFRW